MCITTLIMLLSFDDIFKRFSWRQQKVFVKSLGEPSLVTFEKLDNLKVFPCFAFSLLQVITNARILLSIQHPCTGLDPQIFFFVEITKIVKAIKQEAAEHSSERELTRDRDRPVELQAAQETCQRAV